VACRIFVANINYDVTAEELRSLFSQYGQVTSCTIIADRETGRSRGFGFVSMPHDAEAQVAIEQLDGFVINGRYLRVNEAQIDRHRSLVAR
jgi:RNA recognition motif-containing protein